MLTYMHTHTYTCAHIHTCGHTQTPCAMCTQRIYIQISVCLPACLSVCMYIMPGHQLSETSFLATNFPHSSKTWEHCLATDFLCLLATDFPCLVAMRHQLNTAHFQTPGLLLIILLFMHASFSLTYLLLHISLMYLYKYRMIL